MGHGIESPETHLGFKQPLGQLGIDWDNPITRGLRVCSVIRDGVLFDLIQREKLDSSDIKTNDSNGDHLVCSTTSISTRDAVSGDTTKFALVNPNSTSSSGNVYSSDAYVNGGTFLWVNQNGNYCYGSRPALNAPEGNAPVIGTMKGLVGVTKSLTNYLYEDGEFITSNSAVNGNTRAGITIGGLGASNYFDGKIYIVGMFTRALSRGECEILSRNPYILVKTVPDNIYIPSAAAGGGLSIPIAAYHYNVRMNG